MTRLDPTRTGLLRRKLVAELRRRFAKLKRRVYALVAEENAFALNAFCPTGQGGGVDPTCSPGILGRLRAVGAAAAHAEHAAKQYVQDRVQEAVARLPGGVQEIVSAAWHVAAAGGRAAFAAWSATGALAERAAQERGATPEEARRLRGALHAVDMRALEIMKVAAVAGVQVAHLPLMVHGVLPGATVGYLAYSTARDPLATARAAAGLVHEAAQKLRPEYTGSTPGRRVQHRPQVAALNVEESDANLIADALRRRGYDDWYIALLLAAVDEVGDVAQAIAIADEVYGRTSNQELWGSLSDADKLDKFKEWLREQFGDIVDEELWDSFLKAAFQRGLGRAFDDAKATAPEMVSKEQFLRGSLSSPASQDRVEALVTRALSDAEGVTEATAAAMVRILADGLAEGASPLELGSRLSDAVDGVGLSRGEMIARTEIIRAHAEGQLDGLEDMGVSEVGVQVEWATAGDDGVCPDCASMEGIVVPIEEARGQIPLHPNCRCAWIPAVAD